MPYGPWVVMPNYSSSSPESQTQTEADEGQPTRPGPRRRGRRGGRRRKSAVDGATDLPEVAGAADEKAVSQQLRLLMSPQIVKSEPKAQAASEVSDPQLTYRPPATIESHGAKPAEAPVSAASFKKSESPLQAIVATVGSMAILAALYHFGYWEGAQTAPERQQYASAASLPMMPAVPPDPFPSQPESQAAQEITEASTALTTEAAAVVETAVPAPKATPIPKTEPAPPSAPNGLYLQVAALKDSAAARELELELRTAGFETQILKASDDGLIRVISGPYTERTEARNVARKMSGWGVKPFLRQF